MGAERGSSPQWKRVAVIECMELCGSSYCYVCTCTRHYNSFTVLSLFACKYCERCSRCLRVPLPAPLMHDPNVHSAVK